MKLIRSLVAVTVLLLGAGAAHADRTITITGDSLLFSEPGSLVEIIETGSNGQTGFAFDYPPASANSHVQMYAVREFGSDTWSVLDGRQFLCPSFQMTPGIDWRFLDGDSGMRLAVCVQLESVTVPAGTFQAWRVDVAPDDQPGVPDSRFWFAGSVGMVKQVDLDQGAVTRSFELESYSVTGSGFFPLEVGNTWEFVEQTVSVDARSMGRLKSGHVH